MIPCTEFIPAYSDLFKFIEECGGVETVDAYWHELSDRFLTNLRDLVTEKGIRGCWEYWSQTLNEETDDFTMELDEEAGEFRIAMHHCQSKGRLLEYDHFEPYHDYCRHCDVLYRRVLEPLGYEMTVDMSDCDRAACSFLARRK